MGLLIGSPTNIIVSLNAGINFADYFLLMLVPSVLAIGISFLVLQFINVHFYKWIATFTNLDWGHESHYTMPALSVQPNFTSEMRNWVLFFILVIIAVAKEGARHHGYTGQRGYHPLLARAWTNGAGTGDVLMSRLRAGRANTVRGAAHFLRETVGRVRYAGATGQLTVRADRGCYAHALVAVCRAMAVRCSIAIRHHHPPTRPPAQSHRGHTRDGLDADSLLDGRRRRCGRDHLHPIPTACCTHNLTLRRHHGASTSPLRGRHTLHPAGSIGIKASPSLALTSHLWSDQHACIPSVDSGLPIIPCVNDTDVSLRWIRA